MMTPPGSEERRRSQRLPLRVPLLVVSLDPKHEFSEQVETVEVSNHGCLLLARRPFPRGTRLTLNIPYRKPRGTAHIVRSNPIGPDMKLWRVALAFDRVGDVWHLPSQPRN